MSLIDKIRRRVKDKIFHFLGIYSQLSSEQYIVELESRGCRVGPGTEFFGENNVDLGAAHLISIGKNCIITDSVRLLAHTYDKPILDRAFDNDSPEYSGIGNIDIGDNVFLGERTIVLPNTSIGNNVIIGAGSVVTSDVPDNSVAVGVPCEVKLSLEEYRNRRMESEKKDLEDFVEKCNERGVQVPEEIPQKYL